MIKTRHLVLLGPHVKGRHASLKRSGDWLASPRKDWRILINRATLPMGCNLVKHIGFVCAKRMIVGSVHSPSHATISPQGNSAMAMNIAKIDVAESFLDIIRMSGKCLNRIFKGNTPDAISNTVKKLTSKMELNTDTIKLKKLLGDYMFEQKKYPF